MAQRVTSFAKRAPTAEQPRAEERPPAPLAMEEVEPPDPVPLDLTSIVAPYRKRGRVTVRIERLPHRARLTQGQNNGDHSWSLALDELEDLAYLPPHGDDTQALSIRIIRVDAGSAQTLAVQDYPLPARDGAAPEPGRTQSAGTGQDGKELRGLREELAKAKAALHIRDIELANAKREAEAARSDVQRETIEAELASMRAIWESEVEERLALAAKQAAADLQKHRQEWQANADARVAQAEKRARDRAGDSHADRRRELDEAVAQAQKDWKAAEAARLAAAEAKWQKQSAKALAEAAAQAERSKSKTAADAAGAKSGDAELHALRQELAQSKASLAERENELRKARADAAGLSRLSDEVAKAKAALDARENELSRLRIEADGLRGERAKLGRLGDELAKSKTSLADREGDFARLRAEADGFRGELEKSRAALSAAEKEVAQIRLKADQARSEADTLRADAAELRRVTTELSNAKASLAVRDAELARARASNDDARKRWREEADNALAAAEARWKEAEAERMRSAEAAWRKQSDTAIAEAVEKIHNAEARTEEEVERGRANAVEVGRLAAELTRAKATLGEREGELVQARMAQEQARERWKQETEAALAKAQAEWKSGEAARLAHSQTRGDEEAAHALAEMTGKVKKLEAALSESRTQIEALRKRGNTDDFRRLRSEFASLQATLANREAELMKVRTDHEIDRERWTQEARLAVQRADHQWHEEDTETVERRQHMQSVRRLAGGILTLVVFSALALFGYFKLAPMLTDPSTPIGSMVEPILSQTDLALGSRTPQPAPAAGGAALTISRSVNLRSGPSTTAAVIVTLPRGALATLVERNGNWVRVRIGAAGTAQQEGWIYKTFLSGLPEAENKALPGAAHP